MPWHGPHTEKLPFADGRLDALATYHPESLREREGGMVSTKSALLYGNDSQKDSVVSRSKLGKVFRSEGSRHTPVQQGFNHLGLQHSDVQAKGAVVLAAENARRYMAFVILFIWNREKSKKKLKRKLPFFPAGDVADTSQGQLKKTDPLPLNRVRLEIKGEKQAHRSTKHPPGGRSMFSLLVRLVQCDPLCRLRPAFVNMSNVLYEPRRIFHIPAQYDHE